MKASWYAEALYRALKDKKSEGDLKKVVARFRKVVSARGHDRLLPLIARELKKVIAREDRKHEVTLVVADGKKKSKWMHAYDHYEKEGLFPERAVQKVAVDETIIGGFQIKTNNVLIDGSYKRSLVELYRNITNNK